MAPTVVPSTQRKGTASTIKKERIQLHPRPPASLLSNTHVTTPLIPFIFMTLKAFISPPLDTFKIMFKLYGMLESSSRIKPLSTWSVSLPPFICSCSHLEVMWFSLTRLSSGFVGQAQLCLTPFHLPQPVF